MDLKDSQLQNTHNLVKQIVDGKETKLKLSANPSLDKNKQIQVSGETIYFKVRDGFVPVHISTVKSVKTENIQKEGDDKSGNKISVYKKLSISFFIPDAKNSSTKQLQFPKAVVTNPDLPSVVNAAIHYIFLNDYALKLKDELNKVRSDFESRVKGEEDIFENTDLSVVKLDAI